MVFKSAILIFISTLFSISALAVSADHAAMVKNNLESELMRLGANGVGVAACDYLDGRKSDFSRPWDYCVLVITPDEQTYLRLQKLYPPMTKVIGVFIDVELEGKITPQPRMSGGQ